MVHHLFILLIQMDQQHLEMRAEPGQHLSPVEAKTNYQRLLLLTLGPTWYMH